MTHLFSILIDFTYIGTEGKDFLWQRQFKSLKVLSWR